MPPGGDVGLTEPLQRRPVLIQLEVIIGLELTQSQWQRWETTWYVPKVPNPVITEASSCRSTQTCPVKPQSQRDMPKVPVDVPAPQVPQSRGGALAKITPMQAELTRNYKLLVDSQVQYLGPPIVCRG